MLARTTMGEVKFC